MNEHVAYMLAGACGMWFGNTFVGRYLDEEKSWTFGFFKGLFSAIIFCVLYSIIYLITK